MPDAANPDPSEASPLETHTLQSLCSELVSGRAILVGTAKERFEFKLSGTRALLKWYIDNRQRWSGNVRREDVEALVDSLEIAPPALPLSMSALVSRLHRGIHLTHLKIHNFGGIQRFPDSGSPSVDFDL